MLKSIAAVIGSYLLSIVFVLATDPLLSRLFPGDFVAGRVPSNTALIANTALFWIGLLLAGAGLICPPPEFSLGETIPA
jgi:hypothetical protein